MLLIGTSEASRATTLAMSAPLSNARMASPAHADDTKKAGLGDPLPIFEIHWN